jgi:pantoate--beta-alanine ligase
MSEPIVFRTPSEMRVHSRAERRAGRRVALVPTMGALHDGHRSLIESAARVAETVVVSIFVNPIQFDRSDDFDSYPRVPEEDLAVCAAAGAAAVYLPGVEQVYPAGFDTRVEPGALATVLEGEHRPGHFAGVATVVTKLFGAVEPDVAVFGEKDFQQLAVIRRMTADLDLGVEIIAAATCREPDGLAMSSRNRRLTPAARAAAVAIPSGLDDARAAVEAGERSGRALTDAIRRHLRTADAVDYVAVVDPDSLSPIDDLVAPDGTLRPAVALVAAWFGGVRLIDNRRLTG